uniref:CSON013862 protein n=1 Tax=Culicoides sonorensis TaxID=179676 RepID=A0A336N0S5_CULSO
NFEPMQVDIQAEDNENIEDNFYIVENPSLDLETYAASYTGLAKLHRLIFIANHCPTLRLEALKLAINYVTQTYNVTLYQHLHKKLADLTNAGQGGGAGQGAQGGNGANNNVGAGNAAAAVGGGVGLPDVAAQVSNQDIPAFDSMWVETKIKKAALKLEKLDNDLKNYKSNSIKESIRRGHDDLGDHYLNMPQPLIM